MNLPSRTVVLSILSVALFHGSAEAKLPSARGWQVIGTKLIENGSDSNRIYTQGNRRFDQVKVCAARAPLKLRDADIVYANGRQQDAAGWQTLAAGGCTRAIKLQSHGRKVQYVRLSYERTYRGTLAPIIRITAR